MHIRVLSSCTSLKAVSHPRPITQDDVMTGGDPLRARLADLAESALPAADLYRGQQHRRLMRGVRTVEAKRQKGETEVDVEVRIVSAGFGLLGADDLVPPYDVTFAGLPQRTLRGLADHLGIPAAVRTALAATADLHLVLLGDDYAEAAEVADVSDLGGTTVVIASAALARALPELDRLVVVEVGRQDPARFGTNLIGIRGEIAARLLVALAEDPGLLERLPETDILALLETRPKASDPSVDWVISPPAPRPEAGRLRYFIPDWDDLVDPDYDFEREEYRHGSGGWDHEVYAHQLLERPAYDGLLVSREVVKKSRRKARHLESLVGNGGVHRYLRVPASFPVMGDCGAFGYAKEEVPPYTTDEVLTYYERFGFDYGVSVDHLVALAPDDEARQARYDLTIANAEAFLKEHAGRGSRFVPVGAIQGWDRASYREAARSLVTMGYPYIGVGGLVMTRTEEVLAVLEAIHEVVPEGVGIHVFGLARPEASADLVRRGVTSIDSASPLRKAWLDASHNYWTADGTTYAAVRIPSPATKWPAQHRERGERLATDALRAVRGVDRGAVSVGEALDVLGELERHTHLAKYQAKVRKAEEDGKEPPVWKPVRSMMDHYRCTLEDRPWSKCACAVCQDAGVEVAIFRGNNRNRRRGFHNTHVFYEMLAAGLGGEALRLVRAADRVPLPLFA